MGRASRVIAVCPQSHLFAFTRACGTACAPSVVSARAKPALNPRVACVLTQTSELPVATAKGGRTSGGAYLRSGLVMRPFDCGPCGQAARHGRSM